VDLLVETSAALTLIERAQIKMELESLLNLPVDVISKARTAAPTPFQRIAKSNAKKLETRP
jgi:predicted nucleotidyltransferase